MRDGTVWLMILGVLVGALIVVLLGPLFEAWFGPPLFKVG